jgi:shikimate kinase
MSCVVLIGVPGAGKSTIGELLAAHLGMTFIDTDHHIESRAGKTISDIFTTDGEPAFRELEAATIAHVLSGPDAVVSLGGGALGNETTRELLKSHTVLWLQTGLAQAVDRVGLNRNRPLLLGNVRGQLSSLMTAREPIYREAANLVVDTSDLSIEEVTHESLTALATVGIAP